MKKVISVLISMLLAVSAFAVPASADAVTDEFGAYITETDCYGRLNEGGSLYIVIRKKQGAPSAKQFLASLFGNCETVERQGGYHVLHAVRSKGEKE